MFCLAVTVLFSSLFKSSLAAGGISIAIIITQALFSGLPAIGDYLPGKLLSWGTNLLSGTGESYWWALVITLVLIGLCLYLAQRVLKTKEI
jgi:ABC-2 type transport system permease protein